MSDRPAAEIEGGAIASEKLSEFYIPAIASLAHLPSRTIKQGDTFAIFDDYGDILSELVGSQGIFHEDMRHLARFAITVEGRRPLLLSSTVQDGDVLLSVDLTNPDIFQGGRIVLQKDTVHIHRTKFLWNGTCHERIAVHNYGDAPRKVELGFEFAADFADLFEVRGHSRARRGTTSLLKTDPDAVAIRYAGLDGAERSTRIAFDPQPDSLDETSASFALHLGPGMGTVLFVTIACAASSVRDRSPWRSFFSHLRESRQLQRRCMAGAANVETSNDLFNEMLSRSRADLYMLLSETEHGWYPYAGIPWFSTPFGRDGIIAAMETLWLNPGIAEGVLHYLAGTQATAVDAAADAEPGKILHEARKGEMARLGEVPFERYYGSVDATPLFVMLAGMYLRRTGDIRTVGRLWPNIEAALAWIAHYGDIDGDGFVEYQRKKQSGLFNQGWKDSHDAVSHADGSLAEPPIALCEVQGYVYAAKRSGAVMARALGQAAVAATLDSEATVLREKFEAEFWCDDIGTYALALDGAKRPCRVRSSNAGHALFTGIASEACAERLAAGMVDPAAFSGWGIRTLARGEVRYNPMSYHNGSVWPHDNALIALGMARYGIKKPVLKILEGLTEAATHMPLRRLPELFCGFPRKRGACPTAYPVACAPQAWASGAPFALLQACLGLDLVYDTTEIRFNAPILPPGLDEVVIRDLKLGNSVATLLIRRHGDSVAVAVAEREGDVRVVTVS